LVDIEMVRAMDEEDRAKLADMVILEGCGMLEMASSLSQMKVCKYLVEELGFDVNLGGFRGGACFSSSRLTALLFYEFVLLSSKLFCLFFIYFRALVYPISMSISEC
jgi:hypothetical protein